MQRRNPGASLYQLPKRERFNEDFDAKTVSKHSVLTNKNLSVFNKHQVARSQAGSQIESVYQSVALKNESQKSIVPKDMTSSIPSKKFERGSAEQHRKRILEVVNNLTEEELEKISEMLKQTEEPQNDVQDEPEATLSKEAPEETKVVEE